MIIYLDYFITITINVTPQSCVDPPPSRQNPKTKVQEPNPRYSPTFVSWFLEFGAWFLGSPLLTEVLQINKLNVWSFGNPSSIHMNECCH